MVVYILVLFLHYVCDLPLKRAVARGSGTINLESAPLLFCQRISSISGHRDEEIAELCANSLYSAEPPLGRQNFVEMHQFSDLHKSHGVVGTNLVAASTNLPVHTNLLLV